MRSIFLLVGLSSAVLSLACSSARDANANTTATTMVRPPPTQVLSSVSRPDWIVRLIQSPEAAGVKPRVRIISPQAAQSLAPKPISVRFDLTGGLDMYSFVCGKIAGIVAAGDHAHVTLDNQPYQDCYLHQPCELREVSPGKHTLRVMASRPWHETYKNQDAFQFVSFSVTTQPEEAKKEQEPDQVDPAKPLLTYNSPSEFKTEAADPAKMIVTQNCGPGANKNNEVEPVMIDFWLSSAKLKGDGGDFRVRYFIDDDDAQFIDKWEPIWLRGWTSGKHTVHLELLGSDGWPVKNGGYNIASRQITISGK